MKNVNLLFVVLIGSLFIINTSYASSTKMEPKQKLGKEITYMLDDSAAYLDLKGETVETTLVVEIDDEGKLVLLETGTDNPKLNEYLTKRLSHKKVWTRHAERNFPYYMTVKFVPNK